MGLGFIAKRPLRATPVTGRELASRTAPLRLAPPIALQGPPIASALPEVLSQAPDGAPEQPPPRTTLRHCCSAPASRHGAPGGGPTRILGRHSSPSLQQVALAHALPGATRRRRARCQSPGAHPQPPGVCSKRGSVQLPAAVPWHPVARWWQQARAAPASAALAAAPPATRRLLPFHTPLLSCLAPLPVPLQRRLWCWRTGRLTWHQRPLGSWCDRPSTSRRGAPADGSEGTTF